MRSAIGVGPEDCIGLAQLWDVVRQLPRHVAFKLVVELVEPVF